MIIQRIKSHLYLFSILLFLIACKKEKCSTIQGKPTFQFSRFNAEKDLNGFRIYCSNEFYTEGFSIKAMTSLDTNSIDTIVYGGLNFQGGVRIDKIGVCAPAEGWRLRSGTLILEDSTTSIVLGGQEYEQHFLAFKLKDAVLVNSINEDEMISLDEFKSPNFIKT